MKAIILSTFLTFSFSVGFSQDCDVNLNRETALYMPNDLQQTDIQKQISIDNITEHELCLEATKDLSKQYWWHAHLAYEYGLFKSSDVKLITHAQSAFKINKDKYCKDYVSLHLDLEEEDYPFKPHYLDVENNEALASIKQTCLDEYLSAAIFIRQREEEAKELAKTNSKYNKSYVEALEKIGKKDQEERKKTNINWDLQGALDAENRVALDSLYNEYGFPSVDLVGYQAMTNAFMVMHHSTDCDWNRIWTPRFFKNVRDSRNNNIAGFYYFRHYNPIDGQCVSDDKMLDELRKIDPEYAKKMFNFDYYYKQYKMIKE